MGRMSDSRSRFASPAREERKPKKQKTGGFKWKEKKSRDEEQLEERGGGHLERGYRDRSPKRISYPDRERDARGTRDSTHETRKETDAFPSRGRDGEGKFERADARTAPDTLRSDKPSKEKKKDKKPKQPVSSEPMIIVNINDRLGTKAAIPCLASDSIKAFKAVVAAHIGRQPYEIMLKRQGERPFKDQLTLEDYGVSNGVQLDLELDTGD